MNEQVKVKADDTRARIMDTAEALFRRLGFAKTAVADIASELKMSPANVYRFFSSKNAIIEAICQRCLAELEDRAWAVARSRGLAAERIERLVLEILSYHTENLLTEQRVNDMVLAAIELSWGAIRAHKEHMRMVFESILREGVEAGEFEPINSRETSRLLMISLVHFCHPVLVAQYLQDQEDLEADARAAVRFLLRAIRGPDPCRPRLLPTPNHVRSVTIQQFRQTSHSRHWRIEPCCCPAPSSAAPCAALPPSPRCSFSPAAKPVLHRRPNSIARSRSNASASRTRIASGNSWAWCGRAMRPISASVSLARLSRASSMSAIASRSATSWRASIPRI
ncbi:MAG: TetR/AcrR family transcriptional regulator [Alphaproteobacteria bacterium]|nr:MAG: TetR/AcrR family transcriptional regulator [Alphaproteobacteria bacterium]